MSIVAEFAISFHQFLDETGKLVNSLPKKFEDPKFLVELYKKMVLNRVFDKKAVNLQRTGKMGTYAATLGQEAVGVGMGAAMIAEDVHVPYYRDYAAQFARGVKMSEIYNYWGGDERATNYEVGGKDFPICVPIATQTLHAAGIATAFKLRQQKRAALVTIGDGGTSQGDFYEALNVAGAWQLPLVVVVNNNYWAISVPLAKQVGTKTLAQKAIAAGIHGEQVDGNDVIAMQTRVDHALERARNGEGATLIEAMSYRLCDHTTADDASRYRPQAELDAAWKKEPLIRTRKYLESIQAWDETQESHWISECERQVEAAVNEYLNSGKDSVGAMFDYLYANLPQSLHEQREDALKYADNSNSH